MRDSNYPDVLCDLYDEVKLGLISHQIEEATASTIAMNTAEKIRTNFGGSMLYIPKGLDFDNTQRNQKIISEFNGKNHAELCKRYKISLQWLYKILKG